MNVIQLFLCLKCMKMFFYEGELHNLKCVMHNFKIEERRKKVFDEKNIYHTIKSECYVFNNNYYTD